MAFRFRKSIKIAPGVKFNINKKSVGFSVGTKGVHVSANSSGRKSATVGLPGTGLSYTHTIAKRKKQSTKSFKPQAWSSEDVYDENEMYEEYEPETPVTAPAPPWYQKTHYIILLLFFLFPLGSFYMWKYLKWAKPVKIIISIAGGLTWLCAFLTSSPSATAAALTTLLLLVIF